MVVATSVAAAAPLLAGALITLWSPPVSVPAFAATVTCAAVGATTSRGIRSVQPVQ
ncbi:hypothetical protein [Actinoplanes auranticolor]|uniref:Uncharacterized protein n=1 Tax=Actinoplanes auranticolor TaxID=47988 RepID=A0A919SM94_9ACTN|nr:hypothetical protein [Actinoplanes auranticolor]GIM74104.1 hypothetical protein Aau02nite_59290 [Actinoplanes auranticolor]